uniref:Poly(A) RNA polymerase mitochondrial-like central palm domain-containing protein n=1 Tax=Ditylenchus dipsaci TaxID=166011 RepID=A0A915DS30_9BILA
MTKKLDTLSNDNPVIRHIEDFRKVHSLLSFALDAEILSVGTNQKPIRMNNLTLENCGDACHIQVNIKIKNQQQLITNNHLSFRTELTRRNDGQNFFRMPVWARRERYEPTLESIHGEVMDLYDWIKPTVEEILLRRFVFNRVCEVLGPLFRPSLIGVFGSVATNLFLPTSDIDIAVTSLDHSEKKLIEVVDLLRHAEDFDSVSAIGRTKVPIVKFVHKKTGFNLDISFNTSKTLNRTFQWIQRQKRSYPIIEPLVLVLKRFLTQCGPSFSEPYYGGLSSYALVVMIVHFVERVSPKGKILKLGCCLVEFFKYFGEVYDYKQCLSCAGRGIDCFRQHLHPESSFQTSQSSDRAYCDPLWVQDPTDIDNNIGSACNISLIRSAFSGAYHTISQGLKLCRQIEPIHIKIHYSGPMISSVYRFRDEEILRRQQCIDYMRSGTCQLSNNR